MSDEQPKIETRKVRFLMIDPAGFMSLFRKGLKIRGGFKIIKGIPEDGEILTIAYDPTRGHRGAIMVVVQSESYDEVPVDKQPPVQLVKIELFSNAEKNKKRLDKKKKR